MAKKILAITLAIIMVLGCMPIAGATEVPTFTDMPDDWSTAALESAVANGLLIGDGGKIMPESPVTRAQMATIVARAFGATEEGDISGYTDVKSTDWYAGSIAKAYKMGVMEGYAGLMDPDKNITREQAFAVLARALKLAPATSMNKSFEDSGDISDWAVGEINAMVNAGYIQGSDGKLNPQANIRRNEFAQVMYNLTNQYISTEGEYTEVVDGNLIINVPGVTLKGVTVKGDLIIGDGVGDGEVILEDVIIEGRLLIRGGGENSVIIRGSSSVSQVIVARVDGVVRVHVEGDADVEVIYIDDGSDDVIVEGTVGSIELAADNVTVTATNAKMSEANVSGNNSKIIVDAGSSIGTITTSGANTSVTGPGKVDKVVVQPGGDGAKIETGDTEITVGDGVEDVTAGGGTPVEGGSTATNNADGTDVVEDDTPVVPTPVAVSAISVDKTTLTLTAGGATGTITATVEPSGATNKTVTWSSSSEAVATVAGGVVTPLTAGTTTITATTVDGSFTATTSVTVNAAPVADLTAYEAALVAVAQADYTEASWTTYQAVVADNVVTAENSQAEVDAATGNITAAQAALVTLAEELAAAKTNAKAAADALLTGLIQEDYTVESWTALTNAIAADKAAIDEKTTVAEVTSYTLTGTAAKAALVTLAEELAAAKTNAKAAADALLTGLIQADYTEASWTALTEAIAADKAAIEEKTTVAEVTGYTLTGTAAKEALVKKADLTAYEAALVAVAQADYTEASWTTYQAVVADNVVTAENSQAEVDAATGNITAAQADLVTLAEELATAKTNAKADADALLTGLTQEDYTVESWTALTNAIAADKAAIDEKTTVAEVTDYTLTGTAAKAALVTLAEELATAKTNAKADADALLTGLTQEDYTVESWTALTNAIAADKAAIDEKTTVAEVTSYTLTGTAAKAALVTLAEELAAAYVVIGLIANLPEADDLSINNLEAVEGAEEAFNGLSDDAKDLVESDIVAELNSAIDKMSELVLEDVDVRINEAVAGLTDLENAGIEKVIYENRSATFHIQDPSIQAFQFASTGVIQLFEQMLQDIVAMSLNDGERMVIDDPMVAAVQIVVEMFDGVDSEDLMDSNGKLVLKPETVQMLMAITMGDLNGKSIKIDLTIKPNNKEYQETYIVQFTMDDAIAVNYMVSLIDELPVEISLEDGKEALMTALMAVENADAAYKNLSTEAKNTFDAKYPEFVQKLNNTVSMTKGLLLELVDLKIGLAANSITGDIEAVYEDQTVRFIINNSSYSIQKFMKSSAMNVFGAMFEEVTGEGLAANIKVNGQYDIPKDEHFEKRIAVAILGGDPTMDAGQIEDFLQAEIWGLGYVMGGLAGKSIDIEVTFKPFKTAYVGTYRVEFELEEGLDSNVEVNQGADVQMIEIAPEDLSADEPAESEAEIVTEDAVENEASLPVGGPLEDETESDEVTAEGADKEEMDKAEIAEESAVETDESQLEGDAEVIEETGEEDAA